MPIHMQKPAAFRDTRESVPQTHDAQIFFKLSIDDDDTEGEVRQQPVTLIGYTRKLGLHTLSLVGPFYHFGYRYLMGHDRSLQITLHLPTAAINIQGFPTRYTRIKDTEMDEGYMLTGLNVNSFSESDVNCLIEVSIVVISDADRMHLAQYLRQFSSLPAGGTLMPQLMEQPQQAGAAFVAAL